MPKVDTYGTQQPIALLKTLIERQGFYDREKELNWKKIKDLYYVAAMGPPGGARNPVDPRFVSLFNTFEIQFPSSDNLRTIYAAILKSHTVKLNEDIRGAAENLTDVTLELYNYILEKLPATPSRFPLHLQPQRPLEGVRRPLVLDRGQVQDPDAVHPTVEKRSLANLPRQG
jgi:dynein heavy chain